MKPLNQTNSDYEFYAKKKYEEFVEFQLKAEKHLAAAEADNNPNNRSERALAQVKTARSFCGHARNEYEYAKERGRRRRGGQELPGRGDFYEGLSERDLSDLRGIVRIETITMGTIMKGGDIDDNDDGDGDEKRL